KLLRLLLAWVAASSFLTRLVKLSLVSRAKTMATGEARYCQTRQCFLPAWAPLRFVGGNAPPNPPTGGRDLRASPPVAPLMASSAAAKAPTVKRRFIVEPSPV